MSSVLKFCIDNKIPFVSMSFKLGKNDKGEIVKKVDGIPNGWMKWNFKECMKYNNKISNNTNCLNINLTNSKYMIIDIDDKDLKGKYLNKYGNSYQSKSTRKELPHLWRLKHKDDKNTTKTNYEKGLDLIYTNVFEFPNTEMKNTENPIQIFENFPKVKETIKKDKKDKKVKKETIQIIQNIPVNKKPVNKKIELVLNLIPNNTGIIDYDTWFKIVCSLKNDNINNYDIALKWCSKSERHSLEHFDHVWNYKSSNNKNTISSLYYYAKEYNPKGFYTIIENLNNDDDNLSKLFLKLESENIVYSNEEIFIYDYSKWIKDNNKYLILKKLIRKRLRSFCIEKQQLINKEIRENDDNEALIGTLTLKKVQINSIESKITKKSAIDNICCFVIQDLAYINTNIIFDLGKEQLYNIHFANGCYELNNKQFRPRKKTDYITTHLDWNYKEKVDDKIIKEVDNFYSELQPNKKQKKFSLGWLAYNLNGDTNKQKFKMNIGYKASNGKSTEFKIHDMVFNIYSQKLDSKTFNLNNDKRHKQLIHLIKKPVRFAYCEELKTEKLDVDFIKDFVDGSSINVEIMYGTSESKGIQAKLSTCSNKDFNIDIDKGILRRGMVKYYESEFVDKDGIKKIDKKKHIYEKKLGVQNKFNNEDYKNAYFQLLIKHYDDDFKPPKENEKLFQDIAEEYDEIQQILSSNFRINEQYYSCIIHKDEMKSIFQDKLQKPNLSWRLLLTELKSKGITYDKNYKTKGKRGYFRGITYLEDDDEVSDNDDEIENNEE